MDTERDSYRYQNGVTEAEKIMELKRKKNAENLEMKEGEAQSENVHNRRWLHRLFINTISETELHVVSGNDLYLKWLALTFN